MGYFLQLIFLSLWTRAAAAVEYASASHCTNNLSVRLTPANVSDELLQAAGAHPLPDADGVREGSLTTNDGEPMTMHVGSAMLTILVAVPIFRRRFDSGHAAIVVRELGHSSSRNMK
jgi:hypothetical protein